MHDDSLQKKLWLRIAKHVIEEEQNINQWVGGAVWMDGRVELVIPQFW